MNQQTSIAVIAIVAALAVLGIVVVMVAVTISLQQAEAKPFTPVRGCDAGGVAFNASQGRCFSG
jgi:cytochrome oxidase Cu insertion factor (SCO1/SenC/PrrC family)